MKRPFVKVALRDLVVDLDRFVFEGEVEGFPTRQVPSFLVEPA